MLSHKAGSRARGPHRSTKIVATLGPASSDPATLERMFRAGVDVVRLNFSHGTARGPPAARRAGARDVRARRGRTVGIMVDLQGPKIRVGKFRDGRVTLATGRRVHPRCRVRAGRRRRASASTTRSCPHDVARGRHAAARRRPHRARGRRASRAPRSTAACVTAACCRTTRASTARAAASPRRRSPRRTWRTSRPRRELKADYPRGVVPQVRRRHVPGARAAARRRRQRAADRQDRARRGGQAGAARTSSTASDGIMVARGDLAVEVGDAVGAGAAEAHDPAGARAQQAHHHRDADDGVDDREPGADARRGVRRRQRGARRHRRGDAVGRDRERQVPGRDRRGDGRICLEAEKSAAAHPGPRVPRPRVHARRPVDRHGGAVHRVPPEGEGDRGADPVGLDRAVDVAPELRRADLRAHLRDVHALPRERCSATCPR